MRFLRTVLGDIAQDQVGICYSHEHIIIDASFTTFSNPEFLLDSVERACVDVQEFFASGGRTLVDSMPCGGGRNAVKLAEVSRRTGVNILCPTGLHLQRYYAPGHWSERLSAESITKLFVADIEEGIDLADYNGPSIERTNYKAGLIKVATGLNSISAHEQKVLESAAAAHHITGAPIQTHTEQGTAALEQVQVLQELEVPLGHVVLSHTDRKPDIAYHRELCSTGVMLEYDSAFRWGEIGTNPTLDLVTQLVSEGYAGNLLLGMDAARRKYWHGYGGEPGLAYLLTTFCNQLRDRGLGPDDIERIFIDNPARCYAFVGEARS